MLCYFNIIFLCCVHFDSYTTMSAAGIHTKTNTNTNTVNDRSFSIQLFLLSMRLNSVFLRLSHEMLQQSCFKIYGRQSYFNKYVNLFAIAIAVSISHFNSCRILMMDCRTILHWFSLNIYFRARVSERKKTPNFCIFIFLASRTIEIFQFKILTLAARRNEHKKQHI